MDRWINRACHGIDSLIALFLAIMVVLVFGNVVLRNGFNSGLTVSEEVSRWLFIWGTFLGAVVALKEHGHLGVDMVVQRFSVFGRKVCLVVSQILMLGIVLLLIDGTLKQVFDSQILAQNLIGGADSFPLLAVPFFMLAGEIMNVGGLSRRIVDLALALVGHVKGGLGYVTILAGCLLSALSGSAVADAAALTALLLPMMVKAGHDPARAGGLIAATGVIGPVIPPSIGLVIFGVAANVSISKLFLAAIVPGLLIGGALWLTWAWLVRREKIVPPARKSAAEIVTAFRQAIWALLLPVIILVGLRMGVFTPTEAAVVAAVYALAVSTLVYRELNLSQLRNFCHGCQDNQHRHVPDCRGHGQCVADHDRGPARQSGRVAATLHRQSDPADDRDHDPGDDRGHGDGHDPDDPDPDAGADAGGQGGRHRSSVFWRDVHHQ